jgi:hypothetical protein
MAEAVVTTQKQLDETMATLAAARAQPKLDEANYQQLLRQASMPFFNDVFYVLSLMMVMTLPLVLLMKKGEGYGKTTIP